MSVRSTIAAVICSFFAVSVFAATEPAIPAEVAIDLKWTSKKVTDLPEGVDPTCGGMMPEPNENSDAEVRIAELDLNGDSRPELLVDSPVGGTGGGYSIIYQKERSGRRSHFSKVV